MVKNYKPKRLDKIKIDNTSHRKIIKDMFFDGNLISVIAIELGYTYNTIKKYVEGQATSIRGGEKRCPACNTRKPISEFYFVKRGHYHPYCKYCCAIKMQNKVTMQKNKGTRKQVLEKNRKIWHRRKDIINKNRRIINLTEEEKELKRAKDRKYYQDNKAHINKNRRANHNLKINNKKGEIK